MRAVGVIALSLGALAAGVSSASPVASRPGLRVSDLDPFTVQGFRFEPSERVGLTVTTRRRFVRTIDASVKGAFRVVFRLHLGHCASYAVRAIGSAGSRAAVKNPPQECGAEPGPLG